MCSAPNVYMFVYILIGTHMVPLKRPSFTRTLVREEDNIWYWVAPGRCIVLPKVKVKANIIFVGAGGVRQMGA